jgi:hypothetical protein
MCRQVHVSSTLQSLEPVTKARYPLEKTSKGRSHGRRMWSCQLSLVRLEGKGAGLLDPTGRHPHLRRLASVRWAPPQPLVSECPLLWQQGKRGSILNL